MSTEQNESSAIDDSELARKAAEEIAPVRAKWFRHRTAQLNEQGRIAAIIQRTIDATNAELRREVERLKAFFTDGRVNWDALNQVLARSNALSEEMRTENIARRAQLADAQNRLSEVTRQYLGDGEKFDQYDAEVARLTAELKAAREDGEREALAWFDKHSGAVNFAKGYHGSPDSWGYWDAQGNFQQAGDLLSAIRAARQSRTAPDAGKGGAR